MLLTFIENKMILTNWCIGKIPYRKQNRKVRNYDVNDQNSLLYLLTAYLSLSPFILSPMVCVYELKYCMRWSATIYNIISYKQRTLHEITKFKKVETA